MSSIALSEIELTDILRPFVGEDVHSVISQLSGIRFRIVGSAALYVHWKRCFKMFEDKVPFIFH